ncbi:hypothetical protein B0H14DRAFT_1396847 [Mycena olivaceomarginata]|nr:hypothetical protein B0H14DRAFT_1396847 [Mycena olivaceomarginata]
MDGKDARKRPRENETPSQRLKREKAAERQRRKRERDRASSGLGPPPGMPFPTQVNDAYDYMPQQPQPQPQIDHDLSPDEQARRERVRAAARERQRKHRQLVKQRKMRELGLDMGNDIMGPGMEEVHYRVGADGQYQQVLPHDIAAQQAHQHLLAQAQQHAQQGPLQGEPPFPQGPAHGGQTFATTILLSFSCAPLLKQHLLRTLNMTNDELASLEPVIAEAWDRWDAGRRMRYEHPEGFPPGQPYPPPYAGAGPPPTDDFRGRFQRVMAVPAPFHAQEGGPPPGFPGPDAANAQFPNGSAEYASPNAQAGEGEGEGSSGGGESIDPHLGASQNQKEGEMKGEAA